LRQTWGAMISGAITDLSSLRGAIATKQSILSARHDGLASWSLSSGARSRDPLARNDDPT
jgi:hypothetical protein